MRHPWLPLLALVAASTASALEVAHQPVACTTPDRYVRIAARGVPAEDVTAGEVGFRGGPQSDWYTVSMAARDGEWTALIPRPTAALARFEYRVVLTSRDAATATTLPLAVAVAKDCPAGEGTAVASAIVVRVPPGAPAIPPVPPGFSPVGTAVPAAATAARGAGGKSARILAGIGTLVAGAGVAVAASSGEEAPTAPDIPGFSFERTLPAPGASLSVQRDTLQVFVRMTHEPRVPLEVMWAFELLAGGGGPVCATMFGTYSGAQRPTGLVLSAPLHVSGTCGTTFDVQDTRLRVFVRDTLALDTHIGLPYKVTP